MKNKMILFLLQDIRDPNNVINYYQVVQKTRKTYKVGDLFDIKLTLTVGDKVGKEWVLGQIVDIEKGIYKFNVVAVC